MLRNENPFKNYFLGASLVFGFAVALAALAFTGAVVVVVLAGALALAGAFGAASLAGAAGFSAFGAPVALTVLPPAALPVSSPSTTAEIDTKELLMPSKGEGT